MRILGLIEANRTSDMCILFNPGTEEIVAAFMSKCILRQKSRIFFWDTNLQPTAGLSGVLARRFKRVLFHGVEKFFCMQKDTSGYEDYYGIPKSKFLYIPFKANNIDSIGEYANRDGGYVLACGASWRDYDTFTEAMKKTGLPAKIVLPDSSAARLHNTFFGGGNVPANVEISRHNWDVHSWNDFIAAARVVVVPIHKNAIQPAGISAYLEAMALGKPVVVTEGVSTRGILTNQAVIVPPANADLLATAIQSLWDSKSYRDELALRGMKYALSLGNESRLVKDILRSAIACVES